MNLTEVSRRAGVSLPTIYRWFRGDCLPNVDNYVAMLTVLDASLHVYSSDMTGEETPPGLESSSFTQPEEGLAVAQTPEGRVKDAVKKLLKDANAWWFMPVQTGYGSPELDFICTHPKTGKTFIVETKAPGGYLSARQGVLTEKHTAAGHAVFIIDGEENERSAGQGYFVTPLGLFKKYLDSSE